MMEKKNTLDINITKIFTNSLTKIENNEKNEEKHKFNKMKSSFFGSANPKRSSGFFGSNKGKNTWIDDRPEGEKLGQFYEIRKSIIFNKINVLHNEKVFAKLILDSQTQTNNTLGSEGLFCTPRDVYDWTLKLKENIANYFLVIISYLNAKKDLTALHLFYLWIFKIGKKSRKYLIK